jgi:acetyl-CoA/propionyl-CoA carboxylase, biotin carboxylase, biotin carboxyl carrier protein
VDSGVEEGEAVSGNFDSMIAKLIVTGATRAQAAQRARRALDELVIEGMPTVAPFHRAVMADPAFVPAEGPFSVHTRWIETEFRNGIEPWSPTDAAEADEDGEQQRVTVEVAGKRLEVVLPAGLGLGNGQRSNGKAKKKRAARSGGSAAGVSGDDLTSPMQGTIVKVAVGDGATVAAGDLIVVLEAMKMEQPINAHKAGTISGLSAEVGAAVTSGAVICTIADPAE